MHIDVRLFDDSRVPSVPSIEQGRALFIEGWAADTEGGRVARTVHGVVDGKVQIKGESRRKH